MTKTILLTGGTGLVGTALCYALEQLDYKVNILTRTPKADNHFKWDLNSGEIDLACFDGVRVIINLAGAGIADSRWTRERKEKLIESRVAGPKLLLEKIKKHNISIDAFLSASGINYYDPENSEIIKTETNLAGNTFLNNCVVAWENAANLFTQHCRVVKFRLGVVLTNQGGALRKIEQPIKYYLGAPLGNGRQWVPWVHIEDVVQCFIWAIKEPTVKGVYNVVADEHITNKVLTKAIATSLGYRLLPFGVPRFVLKLIFGEMATLVLDGYRADNSKITRAGYTFKHPSLQNAMQQIYPLQKQ